MKIDGGKNAETERTERSKQKLRESLFCLAMMKHGLKLTSPFRSSVSASFLVIIL